ncbi:MAG: leucine-rich repeat domain-containing protein [Oscillospiraceae bacterium]|nr:leucine-rich repeat domain-containing protein [Oscillospiraceae bacterium]
MAEWLASLKGEKGDPGADGVGITKTEIIDGSLWITYSNDPENPVNVGAFEESKNTTDGHFTYVLLDDGTYGIKASNAFSLISVEIPSTYNGIAITQILDGGFRNQTGIANISFPDSIKEIGRNAFRNCTGLTSIEIPASVECIGAYAFYKTNLTSAILDSPKLWIAGDRRFVYIYHNTNVCTDEVYDISAEAKAAKALSQPVSLMTGYKEYTNHYWYAVDWFKNGE